MPTFYSDEQPLQKQFETGKMADLLEQVIVHPEVQEAERAFIESRDMLFLATVDGDGQPTCSYKGGDPGFVKVVDPGAMPPRDAGKTARAGGTITVEEYESKRSAGEA